MWFYILIVNIYRGYYLKFSLLFYRRYLQIETTLKYTTLKDDTSFYNELYGVF